LRSEEQLARTTLQPNSTESDVRYRCQITELLYATQAWRWWDPRQYLLDVTTGNWSVRHVVHVLVLATLRNLLNFNRGVRILISIHDKLARRWGMHTYDVVHHQCGVVPLGGRTPGNETTLLPGDMVRVRDRAEILETLNAVGRNRGLHFDPE